MKEKIKICVLSQAYPRFKGDWRSNMIASLAEAFAQLGNDLTVYTPFYATEKRKIDETSKVKIVEYKYLPFESMHVIGYGNSMKSDLKVSKLTLLLAPFLVLSGIVNLARLLKKEKFDFLHCHWAVPNTLIALGARWLSGSDVKVLTSFPGSDVTVISNAGFLGRILAGIIAGSDYMSCNSSDLKDALVKSGIKPEKIDYVIYGVDSDKISFSAGKREAIRKKMNIEKDTIMLLIVGRFIPKKGFSTAFRALKCIVDKNKNIKLAVIGDGELKEEYISILMKDNTLDKVIFLGYVNTNELADYYSACDIFLMPSEKNPPDGLNTVVPEAMACGRPIVASAAGGNDLVVFEGVNGFLHEEGDYQTLAVLVNRLIENESLRADMGKKSLELTQARFNWNAIAKYYIEKYKELYGQTN
jgi:glycosyltransferase involved in cell wall biosynthesis